MVRYHPIETEAIIHLAREHTPWKEIALLIGRDVDGTSIRQHYRRVIHRISILSQLSTATNSARIES